MTLLARRATTAVVPVLLALAVAACDPPPPAAVSSSPTPTEVVSMAGSTVKSATATSGGPLTDAETLWLAAFNRMETALSGNLAKGPPTMTHASMLTMAAALSECDRTLNRLGAPGPRLQPVYRPAQQECAAFSKVETCLKTLAAMSTTMGLGSAEERRFQQATDCVAAGLHDGGVAMMDALNTSVKIRSASGDL